MLLLLVFLTEFISIPIEEEEEKNCNKKKISRYVAVV